MSQEKWTVTTKQSFPPCKKLLRGTDEAFMRLTRHGHRPRMLGPVDEDEPFKAPEAPLRKVDERVKKQKIVTNSSNESPYLILAVERN